MLTNINLISCNAFSPSPPSRFSKLGILHKTQTRNPQIIPFKYSTSVCPGINTRRDSSYRKVGLLQKWRSASGTQNAGDPVGEKATPVESERGGSSGGGNGGEGRDWTTSILLFVLWAGLMFYVFILAPNQTPSTDLYFLKKLLNLKNDDGFKMNEVLVSLWYIMGLWPLIYSMLLLPSGRSSNSNVPVWPFLGLSFFLGAYGLLPYFVLWKPPPPPVEEDELERWPLNFLESKFTAGITFAAGLGLLFYAGLAGESAWKEFYQYFRESRFIHATSIDFMLLSSFAPFWVYNDMSARKWYDQGSWLLPFSLVPFLGPALYLVLRPMPTTTPVPLDRAASEPK
ncbi:uncharacterized protein LOC111776784 [Cucurbita pepo subsp. pepo]|uniref:uncharacterized protein LOC111776784 n=1 Tax=Cucurbita pepo subsp. pepo TaxID=3664 RepID=UPI000C9D9754|nr:uncharacterized protein LOC111776784 [Cucurbita pepo subsp. pepo]